jgi:CubicO group peptidase (beta-lactamase class C family)
MRTAHGVACAHLDNGVSGPGSQLVVARGAADDFNFAMGEAQPGRAMTSDTVQALLCLTKPFIAATVCTLAESNAIGLDDDVRFASPRLARMAGDRVLTLRDVLSQCAGLHPVPSAAVLFQPEAERVRRSGELQWSPDLRPGVDHAYSDFQGANVLRHWIEDVSGLPFGTCIRTRVLGPLGIRDMFFGMSEHEWSGVRDRLGVHYEMDDGLPRPLLHELLRKHADDAVMQVVGGYGTASAVANFYRATLEVLNGREVAGLPSPSLVREMVQPVAPAAVDPMLLSKISYGVGFMTDLGEALCPVIGPRAYGHIGVLGGSFAFADPDLDLVVVYTSNGFPYSPEERPYILAARNALIEAIYADVGVRETTAQRPQGSGARSRTRGVA